MSLQEVGDGGGRVVESGWREPLQWQDRCGPVCLSSALSACLGGLSSDWLTHTRAGNGAQSDVDVGD